MKKDVKYINDGNPLNFVTTDAGRIAFNPDNGGVFFSAADFKSILITAVDSGNVKVFGAVTKNPPSIEGIIENIVPITLKDYSIVNTFYDGNQGVDTNGGTKIVEADIRLITWFGILVTKNIKLKVTLTNNQ